MTSKSPKPKISISVDIPVTQEHAQLRHLATKLRGLAAADADIINLAKNLEKIGFGADANEVLGTAQRRGHDPKKEAAHFTKNLAVTWVVTAMAPVSSGGLGLSRTKAIENGAEHWGLEFDTLTRYVTELQKTIVDENKVFSMMAIRPRRKKPED